jgi:AraC-like DNA-binding protein
MIELNRLWISGGEHSLPGVTSFEKPPDRVAISFLASGDGQPCKHCGVDLLPSEIVLEDQTDITRIRTFGPHRWADMLLPHADLALAGRVLADRDLSPQSTWRILRPPPAQMARLQTLHAHAARLALGAPDRLAHPETVRSLEQSLIRTMVQCLSDGSPVKTSTSATRHSVIVAKLEDFLKANHDRPLYLAEICAATGVSERILEVACKEQIGIGPFRYLWLRRMHLARRALLRADPATTTVTIVATDYGFWELGRFSVQYAALFGESPSATLRRPTGEPRSVQNRPCDLPIT